MMTWEEAIGLITARTFPLLPKTLVYNYLTVDEIIDIANRSSIFAADVSQFKFSRVVMKLRFDEQLNDLSCYINKEVNYYRWTFHTPFNGRYYLENNATLRMRKLGELEMEGTNVFDDSTEFVAANTQTPCVLVVKHLRELFPSVIISELEVELQKVTNIDSLCSALKNIVCKKVCISVSGNNVEKKTEKLLSVLKGIEYLDMRMAKKSFEYKGKLVADSLTIGHAGWVTNDELVNWSFKTASLISCCYLINDYVEFLTLWKIGKFPQLGEIVFNNSFYVASAAVAELVDAVPGEKGTYEIHGVDETVGSFNVKGRAFEFKVIPAKKESEK